MAAHSAHSALNRVVMTRMAPDATPHERYRLPSRLRAAPSSDDMAPAWRYLSPEAGNTTPSVPYWASLWPKQAS
jgi:hypothetical protein